MYEICNMNLHMQIMYQWGRGTGMQTIIEKGNSAWVLGCAGSAYPVQGPFRPPAEDACLVLLLLCIRFSNGEKANELKFQ